MKIMKEEITFEDFAKLDIRIGEILSAEIVPDADKLLKLSVDVGLKPRQKRGSPDHPQEADDLGEERDIRQIISGIRGTFPEPEVLVGKKYPFLLNIKPRTIRGFESHGMIIAVDAREFVALLPPEADVPNGSIIR
jgi:methionyl-tRNA synthetase